MTTQNSSSLISSVYKSRKIILELMLKQGYSIDDYSNFGINEVNSMFQNKQLDMLLEKKVNEITTKKIYICYFLAKTLKWSQLSIKKKIRITQSQKNTVVTQSSIKKSMKPSQRMRMKRNLK